MNASDILLLVILLALSAYFSSSETAFSTVNKIRLKSYADSGSEKAKTALDIAEDYDRTLATILVGNNAVNTASAALMTTVASALFGASGAVIATFVTTVLLLIFGLAGGFLLAVWSIREKYTGSLLCWTVVFTPIGTALSIVLARIVDKNRDENTGADGEGVKYAAAKAAAFQQPVESVDSPPI